MNDLLGRGVPFLKITILVMANNCGMPLDYLIFIALGHREDFSPARDRIQTSGFMSKFYFRNLFERSICLLSYYPVKKQ